MMNPRPSPDEVRAWFDQDLADKTLRAGLAVVEADPNWATFTAPLGDHWQITLVYAPTGSVLDWHYQRIDRDGATVWRRIQREIPDLSNA